MKQTYFNVKLEFDKNRVDYIIQSTIEEKGKGYVCSVESNNLTVANLNPDFLKVVNSALVNVCDGSVLAKILGKIHKKPFGSYIGADLFIKYVKMCRYKQFFLGNTRKVLDGLRANLSKIDPAISDMPFEELPFRKVEDFDYEGIAAMINKEKPDIIWVSLGAPKQEFFMARLLPYLNQGVMFGFGAIFNFNAGAGHVKRAPNWMLKLKLEWLYRAFEEPKKNVPRYWNFIKLLSSLIMQERRKISFEIKGFNEANLTNQPISRVNYFQRKRIYIREALEYWGKLPRLTAFLFGTSSKEEVQLPEELLPDHLRRSTSIPAGQSASLAIKTNELVREEDQESLNVG